MRLTGQCVIPLWQITPQWGGSARRTAQLASFGAGAAGHAPAFMTCARLAALSAAWITNDDVSFGLPEDGAPVLLRNEGNRAALHEIHVNKHLPQILASRGELRSRLYSCVQQF